MVTETKRQEIARRAATRPVLYIAGPMSGSGDPYKNVGIAIQAATAAWRAGWAPVIPHLDVLWSIAEPYAGIDWLEWDLTILARCDAMQRLPGESPGSDTEEWFAKRNGIVVFHGTPPHATDWRSR